MEDKEPRKGGYLRVVRMIGKQGRRGHCCCFSWPRVVYLKLTTLEAGSNGEKKFETGFLAPVGFGTAAISSQMFPLSFRSPCQVLQYDEFLSQLAGDLGGFKYYFNYIL